MSGRSKRAQRATVAALLVGLSVVSLSGAGAAVAQSKAAPPRLTGMWLLKPSDFGRSEKPPFTPEALAAAEKQRKATEDGGQVLSDANKKCQPNGMPGMMRNEFALEILETPGRVTIVSEDNPLVRSVYLNKKTHPEDAQPGWNGHSIGHWEGPVLVIDTVALNDRKSHIPRGNVPSGETRIVERMRLADGGKTLVNEMTFTDPKVLTKPYMVTINYDRMPADSELWEYACEVDAAGWSERFVNDPAAGLKPKP